MAMDCKLAILIFANVAFIGLGVGMIIVGLFAVTNVSNICIAQIKPLLDLITVETVQEDSVTLFRDLCISMIIVGALLLVVVGLGFGGACCHNRKALSAYIILILFFLLLKIAIIILWFMMKGGVETEIKHKMIKALKDDFKNDTVTNENSISNAWNHLFMKLECCGVNSFVSTKNDFDDTPWCISSGNCLKAGSQIPRTCCKNVDESTYIFASKDCYVKIARGTYNDKIFAVVSAILVLRQANDYEKTYMI